MLTVSEILGPQGPLPEYLEHFYSRCEQQELAEAVFASLNARQHLVCEAETGIGKTFAYLVPALLSGMKVIISTGTKTLQDQLIGSDYPLIRGALGWTGRVAVLKGRGNYLCHHRLALTEAQGLIRRTEIAEWKAVRRWAAVTKTGDTTEVASMAESAALWPQVTSTVDNCLGAQCRFYHECFVLKARKRAIEADLVIINHHLLFADLALRDQGFGELLPKASAIIVDEAHQLPEIATDFFGVSLSTRQLERLAEDALDAYHSHTGDLPEISTRLHRLQECIGTLRGFLPSGEERISAPVLASEQPFCDATAQLREMLRRVVEGLALLAERGPELAQCHRRAEAISERLEVVTAQAEQGFVTWVDLRARGFTWHSSPLEVSELFRMRLNEHQANWIFISATLRVQGRFDFFTERLGISDVPTKGWESAFDYPGQSICYLPTGLPEPHDIRHTESLLRAVLPILQRTAGRAFLLFTSHRALRQAQRYLQSVETEKPFNLLVQGERPRTELIRLFKSRPRALLLGTSSFWQGVDVRGGALSCVVIDKLPFETLSEPVLQARIKHLQKLGQKPFTEYQVPRAVITLRQGIGRLIRSRDDHGVLVIGDPRLLSKSYGRIFLDSLPPMPVTRKVTEVMRFLRSWEENEATRD